MARLVSVTREPMFSPRVRALLRWALAGTAVLQAAIAVVAMSRWGFFDGGPPDAWPVSRLGIQIWLPGAAVVAAFVGYSAARYVWAVKQARGPVDTWIPTVSLAALSLMCAGSSIALLGSDPKTWAALTLLYRSLYGVILCTSLAAGLMVGERLRRDS